MLGFSRWIDETTEDGDEVHASVEDESALVFGSFPPWSFYIAALAQALISLPRLFLVDVVLLVR